VPLSNEIAAIRALRWGDLPVRQFFENPVQPCHKKYSACAVGQIKSTSSPVPRSSRGAFRDRHERWARDAMDALAATDERGLGRTAKSCGPDVSTLTLSWRQCFRIAPTTVTKRPITEESAKETVKPSRRECRTVSANLW
jgi:hypothetical protein